MSKRRLLFCLLVCLAVALVALVSGLWLSRPRFTSGVLKDLRAGMAARNVQDPDERVRAYLEARFGSMSDSACRQEAFLAFFDLEHIEALQLMVRHSPAPQRQANVDAMARWVASYRASLTLEEQLLLNARLQTPDGQAMLKRATARYNSQDVQYRGSTAPVISQLLKTLHQVEQSR